MCPRGRPRGQGRPRELHLCKLFFRESREVGEVLGYFFLVSLSISLQLYFGISAIRV